MNTPLPERKMAPVQGWPQGIPWSLHLEAYAAYCKKWSPQPALIEGWCRGGFGIKELDEFIPGWRERASEIVQLRSELAHAAAVSAAKDAEIAGLQVYIRVLCRAVDAATDFAGTVAGGASWWDDVWAEHVAELDAARAALGDKMPNVAIKPRRQASA